MITALRRLRRENDGFKVSLGYIAIPGLNNNSRKGEHDIVCYLKKKNAEGQVCWSRPAIPALERVKVGG
jgi:hypothetical protein